MPSAVRPTGGTATGSPRTPNIPVQNVELMYGRSTPSIVSFRLQTSPSCRCGKAVVHITGVSSASY
jgi:hypothetical protein